jgi:hypothetical protein
VNVLIEVPLGGEPIKYELDEKACDPSWHADELQGHWRFAHAGRSGL